MKNLDVNKVENLIKYYLDKYDLKLLTLDLGSENANALILNRYIAIDLRIEEPYKYYVILHELGHYLMHMNNFNDNIYYHQTEMGLVESQADFFACEQLLQCCTKLSPSTVPVEDLLQYCEVPKEVIDIYLNKK